MAIKKKQDKKGIKPAAEQPKANVAGESSVAFAFGKENYQMIFLIQTIVNIVHATYIFILLGKDKKVEKPKKKQTIIKAFTDIRKLNGNLILFLISLTFISLGAINLSKFIEVYMDDIGYSSGDIGLFVAVTGYVSLAN